MTAYNWDKNSYLGCADVYDASGQAHLGVLWCDVHSGEIKKVTRDEHNKIEHDKNGNPIVKRIRVPAPLNVTFRKY